MTPQSDGFEAVWKEHAKLRARPLWGQGSGIVLSDENGPAAALAMPLVSRTACTGPEGAAGRDVVADLADRAHMQFAAQQYCSYMSGS